jgi:hypothetical protein
LFLILVDPHEAAMKFAIVRLCIPGGFHAPQCPLRSDSGLERRS